MQSTILKKENIFHIFLNDQIDNGQARLVLVSTICYLSCLPVTCRVLYLYFVLIFECVFRYKNTNTTQKIKYKYKYKYKYK